MAAYWLRERMNKFPEADAFLHEGLRNNPGSYDILFELGRLYYENYHDTDRARNVWELALRNWLKHDPDAPEGKQTRLREITMNLANLERDAGNYADAISWFQAAQKVSPAPGSLQAAD